MKKIFFIAVAAIISSLILSCEAPAIEELNSQATTQVVKRESLNVNSTDPVADDGPGDNVIVILPPKKP
ncbi:MAG: hypothetical protein K2Y30_01755 [Flavobacteriaceae bacterium]|nr:hypothetical protein [Bacteroidota bacterium]MBX9886642.1 hypothetical protein [Flavobacteriaceae bacterium]